MRLVLASLIAAAAVPALAQTPPPATPPAAAPPPAATSSAPPPAAAEPAAPPAPPPPPAPPTDPAAIALLGTLESVCIPAVDGGNLDKLARSDGFRKSGDTWILHGHGFTFTILPPGSNPTQCHVDLVHPVDVEAPARPMVVALHNWAAVARGWTVYRNDKNVDGNEELTTRSWEHDDAGAHEAIVITTYRHANDAPMRGGSDTSTLIYSKAKS
jgi:hypothetical protein